MTWQCSVTVFSGFRDCFWLSCITSSRCRLLVSCRSSTRIVYITTLACHHATPSPSRMTNDSALHRGALGARTENIDLWVSTGFQMVANCVTCHQEKPICLAMANMYFFTKKWPGMAFLACLLDNVSQIHESHAMTRLHFSRSFS